MKTLLKSVKGKIILAVSAVAVVAVAVVVVVICNNQEESYRTIAVEELHGTSIVSSEGKAQKEAYKGLHLYGGDDVSVKNSSDMTLVLDMNKYLYAEGGTHFWLESEGTSEKSETVIHVDDGCTLHRLSTALTEGEKYEVDTPNSVMAVRGTVFLIEVYVGEDGLIYTLLQVFDGSVQVDLKTQSGDFNGVSKVFAAGESALIRAGEDFSEFVVSDGKESVEIPYKEIPQTIASKLVEFIDDGEVLCIGKELLMDYTGLAEHKMEATGGKPATCLEDGYEEVWCTVCNEVTDTVTIPAKGHNPGDWEVVTEATCQTEGSRQKTCMDCGVVCEEEVLAVTAHEAGEIVEEQALDCTHDGKQSIYCRFCGELMEEQITQAGGHVTEEWTVVSEPTCTEQGVSEKICVNCMKVVETEYAVATGHMMGAWQVVVAATCTAPGSEERICEVCKEAETREIAATGHSMGAWSTVESTCTVQGTNTRVCSSCGSKEVQTLPLASHSVEQWVQETTATCTTPGTQSGWCLTCNTQIIKDAEPATGHSMNGVWEIYEGSCETGGILSQYCMQCDEGRVFKDFEPGHVYADSPCGFHTQAINEVGNTVWFATVSCSRCLEYQTEIMITANVGADGRETCPRCGEVLVSLQ
ncbi:MAG: hypothetical protein IKL78_05185 [Lachnospiraceae bacterium]|nr:hypothetical protein [Lachnospiraceae bacterium]